MAGIAQSKYSFISGLLIAAFFFPAACPLGAEERTAESQLLEWMDRIALRQRDQRAMQIEKVRTIEQAEGSKVWVRTKASSLLFLK